ncbi:histidine phosphatase family protein [Aquincola sp. S2]|uniref:Histidine phosphatase family protein n=1 Tax=Pseudaquabacterium terrae TaxID=2732868 RepID=A0ABX2ERX0_9BURK|nr:histidine phosphatase family protein [Aquabacterium terrae]NRF71492.1 histidine phosphatase family protein [Aquabacterium terrae]
MKTLFLVRHAHAAPGGTARSDRERALDDRGLGEAAQAGRRLAARGVKPALMIASPALRALTTAQLVADQLGIARGRIVVDERIYASSVATLLEIVHALDGAAVDSVMLFGHNPEFTELAQRLSPAIGAMPTCAVAEFRYDGDAWAEVGECAPVQASLDV